MVCVPIRCTRLPIIDFPPQPARGLARDSWDVKEEIPPNALLLLDYDSTLVVCTEQKFIVAQSHIPLEVKRKAFTRC